MTEKFQPMVQGEQAMNTARPQVQAGYDLGGLLGGLSAFAEVAASEAKARGEAAGANLLAETGAGQEELKQDYAAGMDFMTSGKLDPSQNDGWNYAEVGTGMLQDFGADGRYSEEENKQFLDTVGISINSFQSLSPTARAVREREFKKKLLSDERYIYGDNATVNKINEMVGINLHKQVLEDKFGQETVKETLRRFGDTASPLQYATVAAQYARNQAMQDQKADWEYQFSRGEYNMASFSNDIKGNVSANMQASLAVLHKTFTQQGALTAEDQATWAANVQSVRDAQRSQVAAAIRDSGGYVRDPQKYYDAVDKEMQEYLDLPKMFGSDPDLLKRTEQLIKLSVAGAEAGADIDFSSLLSTAKLGADPAQVLLPYIGHPEKLVELMDKMNGPDALPTTQKQAIELSVQLFSNLVQNKKLSIPGYENLQAFWRQRYVQSQKVDNPDIVDAVLNDASKANIYEITKVFINNRQLVSNVNDNGLKDKYNSILMQKALLYVGELKEKGAKIDRVDGKWFVSYNDPDRRVEVKGPRLAYETVPGAARPDDKASVLLNEYQTVWNMLRVNDPEGFAAGVLPELKDQDQPNPRVREAVRTAKDTGIKDETLREAKYFIDGTNGRTKKRKEDVLAKLRAAGYTDDQLRVLE